MIKRKKTREIKVGDVKIGGNAAISIQSMVKVKTGDVRAAVSEARALAKAGCEIVRVAVKTSGEADAIRQIKRRIGIPIVADIHFDYRLALRSIANGADKVRLNPGNMNRPDEIGQVVKAAKRAKIPIRIGVNSGSLARGEAGRRSEVVGRRAKGHGKGILTGLVGSAMSYIKLFEALDFHDIIISAKASDVVSTVEAYREISGLSDYPLHLGVTAAGPYDSGIIRSSIGIGSLLLDGIGDTIRVSLTADPIEEVVAAKRILGSLGIRRFGPEIISCPTCGRCQVDLTKIVSELENRLSAIRYPLNAKRFVTIALMGCEVNGPGEAKEADIGIAFGRDYGILFKKGRIIKRVKVKDAVRELLRSL